MTNFFTPNEKLKFLLNIYSVWYIYEEIVAQMGGDVNDYDE